MLFKTFFLLFTSLNVAGHFNVALETVVSVLYKFSAYYYVY